MSEPLHAGALDALGDANRRAILELLASRPRSVQEIADTLPVSRPAVSRHLRLLKNAGLVADEPSGTRRVYALRAEGIDAVTAYFAQLWGEAAARFRIATENITERTVMHAPLVVEFTVDATAAHAFAIWTQECARWWPADHTLSGDPAAIVFEPHPGGRILERAGDGAEHRWGEVVDWEPPHRLAYRWYLFFTPSEATDVEVTFTTRDDGATRVRIVQTGWERLGPAGPPRRERTETVWHDLTARYARAAAGW